MSDAIELPRLSSSYSVCAAQSTLCPCVVHVHGSELCQVLVVG